MAHLHTMRRRRRFLRFGPVRLLFRFVFCLCFFFSTVCFFVCFTFRATSDDDDDDVLHLHMGRVGEKSIESRRAVICVDATEIAKSPYPLAPPHTPISFAYRSSIYHGCGKDTARP